MAMKKRISLVLVLALCLAAFAGCGQKDPGKTPDVTTAGTTEIDEGQTEKFKIGIMTDTVTQGEEAYRTAEKMVEKYGEDMIVHRTFPDKASSEQETTISTILSLAADPEVKVIVAAYAMEGTTAAFQKVRETRPDILLLGGAPTEDPGVLGPACDLLVSTDFIGMGAGVAETAEKMGATTLVHYSFPRHMANPIYLARHDKMKETCEELGIEFVDGTAPDPMAEAGVTATQQFILEDVPRKVDQYGKDTAFFSTNIGMHEALIKSIYETGALFPHPDTPSPFYAYPGALGIEVPDDKTDDAEWMCDQISKKLAENNMTGRMGVWMPPSLPLIIESLTEYGVRIIEGGYDPDEYLQVDILNTILEETTDGRYSCSLYTGEDIPNFYVYLSVTVLL